MRFAAVAAALSLAGCAHLAPGFTCPAQGGAAWREVETDHFVLQTDLGSGDAAGLVRSLEAMYASLLAAFFRVPPPLPAKVRVVAFRTESEYLEFAPDQALAYFTHDDLGEPLIVTPGALGFDQRIILAHELAHHVTRQVFVRQPHWFAEGIAALAEPLGASGLQTRPSFGGLIPARQVALLRLQRVPVAELLAWDGVEPYDSRYHDSSALLVNYLLHREGPRFVELQRRFAMAEDPAAAWRAAFPEWDPAKPGATEKLDALLVDHLHVGHISVRIVEVEPVVQPVERPLSAARVHTLRLVLQRFGRLDRSEARAAEQLRAEVDEALAEDPDHAVALRRRCERDGSDPLPLARRAARAHPDDPRAWLWLATSVTGDAGAAERFAALQHAVELEGSSPVALGRLAAERATRREIAEAIPLAVRAVRLAPDNAGALATAAAVLAAASRCDAAAAAATRAVEVLPERAGRDERRAFERQRDEILAGCAARR